MSAKLNRDAYQKLVDENIAWLEKQPKTLERDHSIDIVRSSVRFHYDADAQLAESVAREVQLREALEAVRHDEIATRTGLSAKTGQLIDAIIAAPPSTAAAELVALREIAKWARHLRQAASDYGDATVPMLEAYDHEDDGCPEDDSCACPEFVKLREAATRMNKASENLDDALAAAVAAARAGK